MANYAEDAFLQLSGIQHFAFCPRQWALIHLEQQWADNVRTIEGNILHQRAHDAGLAEKRGNTLTLRDVRIHSRRLGIAGACDVVEFYADENGVSLTGRSGRWRPCPVEYKRGKPKEHQADALQLCAQALCLEEMLGCTLDGGMLYYGEERRRYPVCFDTSLREAVETALSRMHDYAARGYTPRARSTKGCNACSLKDICLPKLKRCPSARAYLRAAVEEVKGCENC
ncbi:MAG: CRISPR-associated protein Cas4 [Eubacteriales bacterium]|nr:CRISPR-associated protein Cas4 [Eubacteriales bacterium]